MHVESCQVTLQVRVDYTEMARFQMPVHFTQRIFASETLPKAEAPWLEFVLKDRFDHQLQRRLHHAVFDSYLGRYTHRLAISNNRLLRITEHTVSLRWKDYRNHRPHSVMHLSGAEFCRRFLLHVLPKGLQRIRHYGLLSNRHAHARLDRCRELLAQTPAPSRRPKPDYRDRYEQLTGRSLRRSPACCHGQMHRVHSFRAGALTHIALPDTS
jgi:putative transposase